MKLFLLLFLFSTFLHSSSLEKVSIQFNWKYQFEVAGFIAAKEKGFYENAGLDVELKEYNPDIDILFDVLNQKVTYGISSSNIVLENKKLASIVLLATYLQKSPLIFVTKPDIKTPSQFLGKTIMGNKDELKNSSLALLLSHFNINFSNTKFIPHNFKIDDFISDKVEIMSAFRSNQLYELDKRNIDYNIIDPADYGFVMSAVNLYTSKDEALNHKARTQKFIEATNRGWDYALNNKEEIIDILINKYGVDKSKEALFYETDVVSQVMMRDFYPIGKVSPELTQRLVKQLSYSGIIEPNQKVNNIFFEDIVDKIPIDFSLTKNGKDYLNSKHSLKMCIDPYWYPIEFIKDGEISGITSDLKRYFEEKIATNIELVPTNNWNESLDFIKNKKCDIISSISPSYDRMSYLNFTKPILTFPIVVTTQKDKPFLRDISLLRNEKIAILKGHFIAEHIKDYFPYIKIVEVSSMNEGLDLVEQGDVYGYVDNSLVLSSTIQKEFSNSLKISFRFDILDELSIGTRNDEPILNDIFSRLVDDLDEVKKQEFLNNWTIITEQVGWFSLKEMIFLVIFTTTIFGGLVFYQRRLKVLNKKLKKLYLTDKLTGLYNRFKIDKELYLQKEKIDRNSNYSCGLMLVDIDYFKSINDTLGHLVGDHILKEISNLLKNNFRKIDIVGRWGGEEFLIILPFTSKEISKKVAENLRVLIEENNFTYKMDRKITISVGVTEFSKIKSVEDTLLLVDNLLYKAKENGRNRVEVS
ncbi:diguanylate cyclase [Aliarcobacter cryaerophilus]|uniref:diguanylate cyclase n=1 Tax=Aliarcobacter cryaerophilus ATCC 43158 TaxID=1032070 RepID=A0AAD0X9T7_9BACT|nr:diguanylate cyclase [Aliarcobacter cryaerophilus]AYJ80440.1 BvgS-like domain-containing diguanylate cyclase (NMT1 domain) [Aliarcobacter cryaerophilus ATCC 43158]